VTGLAVHEETRRGSRIPGCGLPGITARPSSWPLAGSRQSGISKEQPRFTNPLPQAKQAGWHAATIWGGLKR